MPILIAGDASILAHGLSRSPGSGVECSADTVPAEDFHVPPTGAGATLQGTVTDKLTGAPVPNLLVFIAGHDSGYCSAKLRCSAEQCCAAEPLCTADGQRSAAWQCTGEQCRRTGQPGC